MNQLEHLKALRDKARVQTEHAKAVLKQQGEISESLDRLIEALEGGEFDGNTQTDSISEAKIAAKAAVAPSVPGVPVSAGKPESSSSEEGTLGQMIAKIDEKKDGEQAAGAGTDGAHKDIVWVEEAPPVIPPAKKPSEERVPPRLEPIVWEVAEGDSQPASPEPEVPGKGQSEEPEPVAPASEDVSPAEPVVEDKTETEETSGSSLPGAVAAAAGVAAAGVAAAALSGIQEDESKEDKGGVKFKFLKFGKKDDDSGSKEETEKAAGEEGELKEIAHGSVSAPVSVPAVSSESKSADGEIKMDKDPQSNIDTVAIDPSIVVRPTPPAPLPVNVNQTEETGQAAEEKVPEGPATADEPPVGHKVTSLPPLPPIASKGGEAEKAQPAAVSSNIFFDANSAYLKESELTKILTVMEATSGGERRNVKIQGLEDLASSNDFKILLASRRVLAVKKKLAEKGVEADQMAINEINLSDEGRVLDPPSILITPRGA